MRPRSGAFHCQTQDQLVQLAESQSLGVIPSYNDKIQSSSLDSKPQRFSGFEFCQQDRQILDEQQQIESQSLRRDGYTFNFNNNIEVATTCILISNLESFLGQVKRAGYHLRIELGKLHQTDWQLQFVILQKVESIEIEYITMPKLYIFKTWLINRKASLSVLTKTYLSKYTIMAQIQQTDTGQMPHQSILAQSVNLVLAGEEFSMALKGQN